MAMENLLIIIRMLMKVRNIDSKVFITTVVSVGQKLEKFLKKKDIEIEVNE